MLVTTFMKPDSESIIEKELDMKSNDKVLMKNELEDSSYCCYYVDSKNFESSYDDYAQSPQSTLQLCVIEAETGNRDVLPGKELIESHSGLDLKEFDISEALLPYLLPAEPDVETDSKNITESDHHLGLRHDDTNPKQPENVHNLSDSDEVDVTTVDNDFLTLFREECEQQVKRQGGGYCQALKSTVKECSAKKEARSALPAQNSAKRKGCAAQNGAGKIVDQKRGKRQGREDCQALKGTVTQCSAKEEERSALTAQNSAKRKGCPAQNGASRIVEVKRGKREEIGKCISSETYICPDDAGQIYVAAEYNASLSPILSTSSRTSEGRMLCRVGSTSTSSSSSICSSSELDPMDDRNWDMFLARKCRNQNELMDGLQICKTRYSDNLEGVHQKRDENWQGISAKTSNDAQFLISSTSSGTSEGKMFCRVNSNSTSASSSICSSSELDLMDERHCDMFLARKCRLKQTELMDDLQIFKTRYNDNPEGVHQKRDENEEIGKGISAENFNGAQSLIPSTNSGAFDGRVLCKVDSNSTSAFSSICSSSELDAIDEREGHKFLAWKSRNKQKELVDDLRISVPRDNPGGVQKKRSKEVEISNRISAETDSGIESPIPSISNETSAGRKRKLCHQEDISATSSFIPHNSLEVDKLGRKKKKKLRRKKLQKELMEDLRLLTPFVLDHPKIQKVNIIIFARDYIDMLNQNLEAKQKRIKDLRKKNKSLWKKFSNLIEDLLDNTPLSWFR